MAAMSAHWFVSSPVVFRSLVHAMWVRVGSASRVKPRCRRHQQSPIVPDRRSLSGAGITPVVRAYDCSTGWIRFPLLTGRLTIGPLRLEDAESLHELYSDPIAMQYLASDIPETVAESALWVQDKIDLHESTGLSLWTVELTDRAEVIGDVGLQVEGDDGSVGVGVRIVRRLWGRGYGSDAAHAVVGAESRDLDLERIIAMTDETTPMRLQQWSVATCRTREPRTTSVATGLHMN